MKKEIIALSKKLDEAEQARIKELKQIEKDISECEAKDGLFQKHIADQVTAADYDTFVKLRTQQAENGFRLEALNARKKLISDRKYQISQEEALQACKEIRAEQKRIENSYRKKVAVLFDQVKALCAEGTDQLDELDTVLSTLAQIRQDYQSFKLHSTNIYKAVSIIPDQFDRIPLKRVYEQME